MAYTVKELARISGVSVRTLHWYDEIGLLKPAYHGTNSYRYYEEEQLLLLQQILFFKELGFNLNDIQKLLSQNDFDNVKALQAHRKVLEDEIARKISLIATINNTIQHLKGKYLMKDEELYYGFDKTQHEQYLAKYYGTIAENLVFESEKRTEQWGKDEWYDVSKQSGEIHKALAKAIEQGLKHNADEVQAIIHRHHALQNRFYECTKAVYLSSSELYAQHPDFKKHFEAYHPKMVEFIGKAMRFYANKNL